MSRRLLTVSLLAAFVAALPADALAQRGRAGGGRGPVVVLSPQRTVVYPPGCGPYGPYGWGWPFGYPGRYPYPYPYYGYTRDDAASLRIETTPRETEVYVDGARAGIVDDYDGVFQRLHLTPGNHEITLYLQGYRSWSESRYFGPRSSSRILHTMLPLAAGQADDPRPVPAPPPQAPLERAEPRALPQPAEPNRPAPRPRAPAPMIETRAPERPRESRDNGTLSVGINPGDAEITLDGQKQTLTAGADRLVIQLPEGVHRLVVQKAGYSSFETDLQIRRGRTLNFDVRLVK